MLLDGRKKLPNGLVSIYIVTPAAILGQNEAKDVLQVIQVTIACALPAAGFTAGGIGMFMMQAWWRPVVVGAAAFSAVLFILFWDGKARMLAYKGGVGLLINLAILAALFALDWPRSGF